MTSEITGLEGELPTGKIVIVASRYNPAICDSLVSGSIETLTAAGYSEESIVVVRVPGAWELPTVVRRMIQPDDVIAAIALGCVINCLLYTSPSPRDQRGSRMPSSA